MQMTFFVLLPSILLSGFMFFFGDIPRCAQVIGEFFSLAHFLRIIRGILLKATAFPDLTHQLADRALRRDRPHHRVECYRQGLD